jgi:hypothetical protein
MGVGSGREGEGRRQGGEMTQTMYAHVNKWIKKENIYLSNSFGGWKCKQHGINCWKLPCLHDLKEEELTEQKYIGEVEITLLYKKSKMKWRMAVIPYFKPYLLNLQLVLNFKLWTKLPVHKHFSDTTNLHLHHSILLLALMVHVFFINILTKIMIWKWFIS